MARACPKAGLTSGCLAVEQRGDPQSCDGRRPALYPPDARGSADDAARRCVVLYAEGRYGGCAVWGTSTPYAQSSARVGWRLRAASSATKAPGVPIGWFDRRWPRPAPFWAIRLRWA